MYRLSCRTCGTTFDAMAAAECNCLDSTGTFVCPRCGNCFCTAGREFIDSFWASAPAALWQRRRERARRAAAERGEADASKPIVLFADDDPAGRRIAQEVIGALGYTVIVVKDGEELLEKARQVKPELVITDALMPRRDGRDSAKLIREELPATRIVVITSVYKDPRYKHEAFRDFGVDEYLTKPVAPQALRDLVRRLMPAEKPAE